MTHPFLVKAPSSIDWTGIFTEREIKKGEDFYKVPLIAIHHKPTPRCAFIGNNTWVSDEEVLNYVNHSCEPNARLELIVQQKSVAVRRIMPGEEITVDYNKTEQGEVEVPCNCREASCRGYFLIKNQ